MRTSIVILFVICIQSEFILLNSQGTSIFQETIFGSRLRNPIVIDVRNEQKFIYFNVQNNSYFPYEFEVKFGDFRNLSPRVFDKKTTLMPGINRLFTFKIVDPTESPVLSYQTSYYMAKSNSSQETFKPYIIPIGKNKTVRFLTERNEGSSKIYVNQFVMDIGDTVYNSRKGLVTAIPDDRDEADRIIASSSLEIRHDDGTIGVYDGLGSVPKVMKAGQTVFPGQPIGIIGNSKLLMFQVFKIEEECKLQSIKIVYSGANDQLLSSENIPGTTVIHSNAVIKKEMTKKEISKFEKHTLY
jgi:hypothetical protein